MSHNAKTWKLSAHGNLCGGGVEVKMSLQSTQSLHCNVVVLRGVQIEGLAARIRRWDMTRFIAHWGHASRWFNQGGTTFSPASEGRCIPLAFHTACFGGGICFVWSMVGFIDAAGCQQAKLTRIYSSSSSGSRSNCNSSGRCVRRLLARRTRALPLRAHGRTERMCRS